jgi:hypothetical protein
MFEICTSAYSWSSKLADSKSDEWNSIQLGHAFQPVPGKRLKIARLRRMFWVQIGRTGGRWDKITYCGIVSQPLPRKGLNMYQLPYYVPSPIIHVNGHIFLVFLHYPAIHKMGQDFHKISFRISIPPKRQREPMIVGKLNTAFLLFIRLVASLPPRFNPVLQERQQCTGGLPYCWGGQAECCCSGYDCHYVCAGDCW